MIFDKLKGSRLYYINFPPWGDGFLPWWGRDLPPPMGMYGGMGSWDLTQKCPTLINSTEYDKTELSSKNSAIRPISKL